MRIHLLGLPHTITSPIYNTDAYCMANYYLVKYLTELGNEVFYYGHDISDVNPTHFIGCIKQSFRDKWFYDDFHNQSGNHKMYDTWDSTQEFIDLIKPQLLNNLQEGDIVAPDWSVLSYQFYNICKGYNVKVVDAHIGHNSSFNPEINHCVFTSHPLKYHAYGDKGIGTIRWGDEVIPPPSSHKNDFEFKTNKEDYFLFMGRLNIDKGAHIMVDVAEALPNENFIIAGKGYLPNAVPGKLPPNVTFVGKADTTQRKKLMSNAKGLFCPTTYLEPFGLVSIEAAMSGTPVISTSWGGWMDNVNHGVSGYRCSSFREFLEATEKVKDLNPYEIQKWGNKFSAEECVKKYHTYFERISTNFFEL